MGRLGFLVFRLFAAKTQVSRGWKSLDFLGFSRPKRDLSIGYAVFSGNFFPIPFRRRKGACGTAQRLRIAEETDLFIEQA
jgi:hypothetical protein